MATAIVILAIWTLLSIPMSVLLGTCLKEANPPELIGMDGPFVVYRGSDGSLQHISLGNSASV